MIEDKGITFLIATDVHLGHKQKHSIRHNDSFQAFQEVISYAKSNKVDFVLLGGDLFDEVNPTKESFFKCLSILKENVFGNTKIKLAVSLNGQNFRPNFSNQDINIELPIFTIHGNHDYPTNEYGKISVCDLLQASNYVNYFGKYMRLDSIIIKPLLITKSDSKTKIALYGLGYIKDMALNELFNNDKVVFEKPAGNLEDYVTIFVLHQNRYKKGFQSGVPLNKSFDVKNIPEWINITIWGHQHEAIYRIDEESGRKIYQPGSTVITSYIEAESIKKQCVLFNAKGNKFDLRPLLLQKSFRPMHCQNFQYSFLKERFGQDFNLEQFLDKIIYGLIQESQQKYNKEPIIRFKIQYTGVKDIMKIKQIESKYSRQVANFDKIFMLWKKKEETQGNLSEKQFLHKLKNKVSMKDSFNNVIVESIEKIFKEKLQKYQFKYYSKDQAQKLITDLGKGDSIRIKDHISKKFEEMSQKRNKAFDENFNKITNYNQTQFKRSAKYYKDKKQFIIRQKINKTYYGIQSYEQFLNLQKNIITENQYQLNCTETQNMKNNHDLEQGSINLTNQESESQHFIERNNILNRQRSEVNEKSQRSTVSINHKDQIDSEDDCCVRALKTPFDQQGTKMKFQQVNMQIKLQENSKRKKTSFLTKERKEHDKQQKRAAQKGKNTQKSVRFSDNFM